MLNQVVLVGRIVELKPDKGIRIAIPRSYKNEEGVYDTDTLTIFMQGTMLDNTAQYCSKGDLVGIKGRLQEDSKSHSPKIIADKLTFLASQSVNSNTDDNNREEENHE